MIRIFLVDDHEMVREGMTSFFALQTDMVIWGEAATAAAALDQLAET